MTTFSRLNTVSVLVTLTCLLLFNTLVQAGGLKVDNSTSRISLDPYLDYLDDRGQVYHLGQIVGAEADLPWKSGENRNNGLMMESGLYWFKGQLINSGLVDLEFTLQVEHPSINIADLYMINPKGDIQTVYSDAGLYDRFTNRPSPHRNLVSTVVVPANSSMTLIWRIESEPLFQFRATLWQPTACRTMTIGLIEK